jgi:hypothetical protein
MSAVLRRPAASATEAANAWRSCVSPAIELHPQLSSTESGQKSRWRPNRPVSRDRLVAGARRRQRSHLMTGRVVAAYVAPPDRSEGLARRQDVARRRRIGGSQVMATGKHLVGAVADELSKAIAGSITALAPVQSERLEIQKAGPGGPRPTPRVNSCETGRAVPTLAGEWQPWTSPEWSRPSRHHKEAGDKPELSLLRSGRNCPRSRRDAW